MDKSQESDRTPNSVDQHVGMRVRVRRRALGISQEKLSEALNLTFQQVQKYERGANRISASKLYDIARALHAPISYFFEGLADPMHLAIGAVAEPDGSEFLYEMVMTTEGMELAALFPKIDRRRRKLVLELARALSSEFNEPAANVPD
jgi:transcriptional regulator with XRE-family HTH domain